MRSSANLLRLVDEIITRWYEAEPSPITGNRTVTSQHNSGKSSGIEPVGFQEPAQGANNPYSTAPRRNQPTRGLVTKTVERVSRFGQNYAEASFAPMSNPSTKSKTQSSAVSKPFKQRPGFSTKSPGSTHTPTWRKVNSPAFPSMDGTTKDYRLGGSK
jgi:hypothetical protein